MPQVTNAISFKNCKVEISTNGTTWTDISGFANSIEVSGGDRQTGETYTFDGDTAIIAVGKREPWEITLKVVYTEGVNEPFEVVRAAYESGTSLYVRWSPKGGASGSFQYTSAAGVVTAVTYPSGEAGSGDPLLVEFTVKVPGIVKGTVA